MIRIPPQIAETHYTKPEVMRLTGLSVTAIWERDNAELFGPKEYCGRYRVYRKDAVEGYLKQCVRRAR